MDAISSSSHSGFTLLEIVVVLLISSLMTGLGHQYLWTWQQHQQAKASARDLAHFLNRLRQQANHYHLTIALGSRVDARGRLIIAQSQPPSDGTGHWIWRPATNGVKVSAVVGEPQFFGKRGTAWPGSVELGGPVSRWRVIISSQGRVRYCQLGHKTCQ